MNLNSLPEEFISRHNMSLKDDHLVCLTPDCKFSISIENAKDYNHNKKKIQNVISEITTAEIKDLKLRVISKLAAKITEQGLVQKETDDFLKTFLTKAITPNKSYNCFKTYEETIRSNIDKLNQICPFTEENFQNDFREKKYIDKSKRICRISAHHFESQSVEGFLATNFDDITSFLEYLFLKEIPNFENITTTLTKEGNISVTLKIQHPEELAEGVRKEYFLYTKKDIELETNGSEAFKKLELDAIADIAISKFKNLHFVAFKDITNIYISDWSGAKDYITIYSKGDGFSFRKNISLTDILDTSSCEINIEKFKKSLEKEGFNYDVLIDATPRNEEAYDEIC